MDDLEAMDIYSHADTVDIVGADADETELLLTAWEILHQNLDLVEWAACMVLGSDSADIGRLLQKIQRSWLTVRIKVSDDCTFNGGEEAPEHAVPGLGGGTIYLCARSSWAWKDDYVKIWTSGPQAVDRWCGALDLAATLLHELYHTIGIFGRAYDDHAGQCATTYLIENAFRFVLFRRYPTITNSACCSSYLHGGWLVGNSHGIWTRSEPCIQESDAMGGFDSEEWIETKGSMEEWPKS